jgi:hypothetical protein
MDSYGKPGPALKFLPGNNPVYGEAVPAAPVPGFCATTSWGTAVQPFAHCATIAGAAPSAPASSQSVGVNGTTTTAPGRTQVPTPPRPTTIPTSAAPPAAPLSSSPRSGGNQPPPFSVNPFDSFAVVTSPRLFIVLAGVAISQAIM